MSSLTLQKIAQSPRRIGYPLNWKLRNRLIGNGANIVGPDTVALITGYIERRMGLRIRTNAIAHIVAEHFSQIITASLAGDIAGTITGLLLTKPEELVLMTHAYSEPCLVEVVRAEGMRLRPFRYLDRLVLRPLPLGTRRDTVVWLPDSAFVELARRLRLADITVQPCWMIGLQFEHSFCSPDHVQLNTDPDASVVAEEHRLVNKPKLEAVLATLDELEIAKRGYRGRGVPK